jgi:hypothetical protein
MKKSITLDEAKASIHPPERVIALQAERDQIASAFKEYQKEHGQLEQLMAETLASIPAMSVTPPVYVADKKSKVSSEISACLHLTDQHYGAVQDADEVEGFGRYSPEISRARQLGLVENFLNWVQMHRYGYTIPEARFLCTGDPISGDIHDELKVTNAFPAPQQAVEQANIMAEQVAMAAPHFKRLVVDMITLDNHGRLTRKPQCKEGGRNNWGYVIANMLKLQLASYKNVEVNIHTSPMKVVNVNGRRYLLCHGHDTQSWMSIPYYGIERKISREALKRMNGPDFTKFDKVVMGHFHCPMLTQYFIVGGSVSGTDAYDHQCGRYAAPQQLSWLVHPNHGEFDTTSWDLSRYS